MTLEEFTASLDAELRARGVDCDAGEVGAFAETVWWLAAQDPSPIRWALEFLESRGPYPARKRRHLRSQRPRYSGRAAATANSSLSGPHAPFLEAIGNNSDDDGPIWAYADWLEEHGHPGAEFLRLQIALDGRSRWDEGYDALTARERGVYPTLDSTWLAAVDEVLAFVGRQRWEESASDRACLRDGDQAERHARNIMRRVRWNIEHVVNRLKAEGYLFPPGCDPYTPPTRDDLAVLDRFDTAGLGDIPLSVRVWVEEVGSVSLTGTHPGWPFNAYGFFDRGGIPFLHTDPLCTSLILSDLENAEHICQVMGAKALDWLYIGSDAAQKAYTSGGSFGMSLAGPAVEGIVEWEGRKVAFIDYVREAFSWGGFPGLKKEQGAPQWFGMEPAEHRQFFEDLQRQLCRGLRPF